MTELQFLIDLLLNHKLNPTTKKLVADRIGQVESTYRAPLPAAIHSPSVFRPTTVQAPSTQAILDREVGADVSSPTPLPTPVPKMATDRIVGGEINTGQNIKGKRKW